MKTYEQWKQQQRVLSETDRRDEEQNAWGGLDPHNQKEKQTHKHADLITLPPDVKGTNCGNCKFIQNLKEGVGHCGHHDLQCFVTVRMCCKYWDNTKVERKF